MSQGSERIWHFVQKIVAGSYLFPSTNPRTLADLVQPNHQVGITGLVV